ncbi:DUF4145 domain-containing protein [Dechloromonas denitrificans]|uniref:DUF4145 domain-containing protein n=1 Tax=Dechloromonas denitrificans TaxID=281362 RepID=UPI001CF94761|nr:DUF4145 domain-containing protein [Dechloromonas denitrificans]UCV07090.1 DUF4145 domain-containing protein [Dechloromonas denitrificans]
MANDYSWTCPYCRQVATIKSDNVSADTHSFDQNNKHGHLGLRTNVTVCPNSKCREFTMTAALYKAEYNPNLRIVGKPLLNWSLKPQSSAKPFPDYIPLVIRQDYEEACLVCALSPKASATLARRCLQGIIRDFWGISKSRLIDEISELHGKIDASTWQAIDAVRSIGNIGAHMEKDINLIVEVDPEEADLLLRLIEVLLEEWYIHRYEREAHMQKVIAAAQAKTAAKNGGNP